MDSAGFYMTLSNTLGEAPFPTGLISLSCFPAKQNHIIAYSNFVVTWIRTDYVIRCNDNNYCVKVDNGLWREK